MGPTGRWLAFAAVLATMPDLVERLMAAHTPTPDGRLCTACTTPGQGTPQAPWPCAIALVAAEAARAWADHQVDAFPSRIRPFVTRVGDQ
jgi:anthranilate phosphoribosyltransferase